MVDRVATPGLAKAASSLAKHKQASLRQSNALGPPWGQTGVLSNRNLCGSACDLKPLLNPVAPHNVAFKLMMPRVRRGGQNPYRGEARYDLETQKVSGGGWGVGAKNL